MYDNFNATNIFLLYALHKKHQQERNRAYRNNKEYCGNLYIRVRCVKYIPKILFYFYLILDCLKHGLI